MNNAIFLINAIKLEGMSNDIVLAANMSLQLEGSIPKDNLAYQPFLEALLIYEDGTPINETLLIALINDIEMRYEEARFDI